MGGGGGDSTPPGSASQLATLQNLIKPFVGAGILALPNAFKQGGVLVSAGQRDERATHTDNERTNAWADSFGCVCVRMRSLVCLID